MNIIHIPPLRWYERFGDWLMKPIMYFVSGTLSEKPQRTHRWNNTKLKKACVMHLWALLMVHNAGVKATNRYWFMIPMFHLPIAGGWKEYLVIEPCSKDTLWHVGWIATDVIGVSRVPVHGPIRVLLGPDSVTHFGLDAQGRQLMVRQMGRGLVCDEGPYAELPLF